MWDDLAKLSDIQLYRNSITFGFVLGPKAHPNTSRMVDQISHLPLQKWFLWGEREMKEVRLWILPPSELEKKIFTAKIVREGIRKQHAPCTSRHHSLCSSTKNFKMWFCSWLAQTQTFQNRVCAVDQICVLLLITPGTKGRPWSSCQVQREGARTWFPTFGQETTMEDWPLESCRFI